MKKYYFFTIILLFIKISFSQSKLPPQILFYNATYVNIDTANKNYINGTYLTIDSNKSAHLKHTLIYFDSIHIDSNVLKITKFNNKYVWHDYPNGILSNKVITDFGNNIPRYSNEYITTKSYPPFRIIKKKSAIFYKPVFVVNNSKYCLKNQVYQKRLMYSTNIKDTFINYSLENIFKKTNSINSIEYSTFLGDTIININNQNLKCNIHLVVEKDNNFEFPTKIFNKIYFESNSYLPILIVKYIYKNNSNVLINRDYLEKYHLINIEYYLLSVSTSINVKNKI